MSIVLYPCIQSNVGHVILFVVFGTKKNLHISGPAQSKLFCSRVNCKQYFVPGNNQLGRLIYLRLYSCYHVSHTGVSGKNAKAS